MELQTNNPELLPDTFFLFGSKLKTENKFFLQIVETEKKKKRLEKHFSSLLYLDWYCMPLIAPSWKDAEEIQTPEIEPENKPQSQPEEQQPEYIFKPLKFEF